MNRTNNMEILERANLYSIHARMHLFFSTPFSLGVLEFIHPVRSSFYQGLGLQAWIPRSGLRGVHMEGSLSEALIRRLSSPPDGSARLHLMLGSSSPASLLHQPPCHLLMPRVPKIPILSCCPRPHASLPRPGRDSTVLLVRFPPRGTGVSCAPQSQQRLVHRSCPRV